MRIFTRNSNSWSCFLYIFSTNLPYPLKLPIKRTEVKKEFLQQPKHDRCHHKTQRASSELSLGTRSFFIDIVTILFLHHTNCNVTQHSLASVPWTVWKLPLFSPTWTALLQLTNVWEVCLRMIGFCASSGRSWTINGFVTSCHGCRKAKSGECMTSLRSKRSYSLGCLS